MTHSSQSPESFLDGEDSLLIDVAQTKYGPVVMSRYTSYHDASYVQTTLHPLTFDFRVGEKAYNIFLLYF